MHACTASLDLEQQQVQHGLVMQTDHKVGIGDLLVQLLPGLRIDPLRNPALNFMQVWPLGRRNLDNRRLLQSQMVRLKLLEKRLSPGTWCNYRITLCSGRPRLSPLDTSRSGAV